VALRDITINKTEIEVPGGDFAVRGLALIDVNTLFSRYADTASDLFKSLMQGEVQQADSAQIANMLVKDAPALAAALIATAADEPEMEAVVSRLPFPIQIEALEAIGKLTFTTEGSLKKVFETLIQLLSKGTDAVASLR
jgi:hypothetical protein